MERLTKGNSEMAWYKGEYKGKKLLFEPCEVKSDCSSLDIGKILRRLAYYEDMEEKGRLVVLPMVDIGDVIYDIWEARRNGTDEIRKIVVTDIYAHIDKRRRVYFIINGYYFNPDDIGQTVFFDPESAKNALKGGAN